MLPCVQRVVPAAVRRGVGGVARIGGGGLSAHSTEVPESMQAVKLPRPGPIDNMVLESAAATPRVEAADEVVVRVSACGVCHRDLLDRAGAFPFIQPDSILGHEIAGTVVQAGVDSDLAPGDRVVSLHWAPCGHCRACAENRPTHCHNAQDSFFALTADGGYAGFTKNKHSAFVKLPDAVRDWNPEDAAVVMCTFGTVWHAAITRGGLRPGESVLVTGASGGVGSAAVQMLSAMGCHVTAVTSSAGKEDYCLSLGAEGVIVTDGEAPMHRHPVVKATGGFDAVFEAVGAPTLVPALRTLRPGGRLLLVGNVTNSTADLPLGLCIIRGLSVIGSDSVSAAELRETFQLLAAKDIKPNVHSVLELHDVHTAHRLLENRGVQGRVVLRLRQGW